MNSLFGPARFLLSLIGDRGRFHALSALVVLLGVLSLVDEPNLRLGLVLAVAIATVYLIVALSRGIDATRAKLQAELGRIGSGDLSVITKNDSMETDAVNETISQTRDSLARIVSQVRETSNVIVRSTKELGAGNQRLSERTEHQASTLEEATAGMEQLSATVAQNAANAAAASERANKARVIAQSGSQDVNDLIRTVSLIEESSKRVTEIIDAIEGIAFQTNILALNAAVEAARAVEQGRGFAVVAKEVRNLAQRSSDAVRETRTLIAGVTDRVASGNVLAKRAEGSIANVTHGIMALSSMANFMSSSMIYRESVSHTALCRT